MKYLKYLKYLKQEKKKIALSQANISDTDFAQRPQQPLEVLFLQRHKPIDRQTDRQMHMVTLLKLS